MRCTITTSSESLPCGVTTAISINPRGAIEKRRRDKVYIWLCAPVQYSCAPSSSSAQESRSPHSAVSTGGIMKCPSCQLGPSSLHCSGTDAISVCTRIQGATSTVDGDTLSSENILRPLPSRWGSFAVCRMGGRWNRAHQEEEWSSSCAISKKERKLLSSSGNPVTQGLGCRRGVRGSLSS